MSSGFRHKNGSNQYLSASIQAWDPAPPDPAAPGSAFPTREAHGSTFKALELSASFRCQTQVCLVVQSGCWSISHAIYIPGMRRICEFLHTHCTHVTRETPQEAVYSSRFSGEETEPSKGGLSRLNLAPSSCRLCESLMRGKEPFLALKGYSLPFKNQFFDWNRVSRRPGWLQTCCEEQP